MLIAFLGSPALAQNPAQGGAQKPGNGGGNGHGNGNGGGNGNGHGNAGGNGNGHGNGGGNGTSSGGGTLVAAPSSPSTSGSTDSGGSSGSGGNGNGHGNGGNGRGNGNGHRGNSGSGSSSSGSATSSGSSSSGSGSSGRQNTTQTSSGSSQPASSGSSSPSTVTAASATPTERRRARQQTQKRRRQTARRAGADRRRAHTAAVRRSARRGTSVAGVDTRGRAAAGTTPVAAAGAAGGPGANGSGGSGGDPTGSSAERVDDSPVVVRTLQSVVEVIPGFIKAIIALLATALLVASGAWFLLARNARFLRRQREKLLGEMGVLQGALLPHVPPELNRLEASVAYRPAEGLAAGGDFYDAFPLDNGRVGIVVGDVAGHGKDALMHTALLRYTMRAYLEAGLKPRTALQVAGRVLDRGFDTLATVVLAIYNPARHELRYATAGHPPPVFLGEADHIPVTRASSPPIGAMLPTGLRQTTVSLPAGSAACFFTDGLIEARRDGEMIGRLGLVDIIRELGPHATAQQLLDRVAADADYVGDDMAACMFRVSDGPSAEETAPRREELELLAGEPVPPIVEPFLTACGIAPERIQRRIETAEGIVSKGRGAIVTVTFPPDVPPQVTIDPANVESLAAAQVERAAV